MKNLFLVLSLLYCWICSAQLTVQIDSTEKFYLGGFVVISFQDDKLTYTICDDTSLTDHFTKTLEIRSETHSVVEGEKTSTYKCLDGKVKTSIELSGAKDFDKVIFDNEIKITYTGNINIEDLPPAAQSAELLRFFIIKFCKRSGAADQRKNN